MEQELHKLKIKKAKAFDSQGGLDLYMNQRLSTWCGSKWRVLCPSWRGNNMPLPTYDTEFLEPASPRHYGLAFLPACFLMHNNLFQKVAGALKSYGWL
ncbi:hypothetical protein VNO78_23984 [Psophocarpus tetragonolobus]|uniref:Uncharacterized protein n=1 Tax=Psophocarpus tetragonolobus TaxID=3891 RepID=A0AAN9S504_PSOTE